MQLDIKNYFSDMNVIEKNDHFLIKARYGPSEYVKIDKNLTPDLFCFVGIILGDGHLHKIRKRVKIDLIDKNLLEKIQNLVLYLFNKKARIFKRVDKRKNRNILFHMTINSKAIYVLLNKLFEVPIGKKSNIIQVPQIVKNSSKYIKKSFIVGVMASDGGKRGKNLAGLSTASEKFRDDLSIILDEIGIKNNKDQWINKRYKKMYFGLKFKRDNLDELRECQSGQMGQILNSFLKKVEVKA